MSKAEKARFLAQFAKSKKEVASWPKWMRDAAQYAAATLPSKR